MVSRLDLLNELDRVGILPSDYENYTYHAQKYLTRKFEIGEDFLVYQDIIRKSSAKFASKVKEFYVDRKWGNYSIDTIRIKKEIWLSQMIDNPKPVPDPTPKRKLSPPPRPKGRQKITEHTERGRSAQYAHAAKTVSDNSLEDMLFACMTKASKDGLTDLHYVLQCIYESPATQGSLFRKSMVAYQQPEVSAYTPEEALALIIEINLTQKGYNKLRKRATKLYPSYYSILKLKKTLEPKNVDKTKPDEIDVPMQDALDNQMTHILQLPKVKEKLAEVIQKCEQSGLTYELKSFFKYGADGTTGNSQWQHKRTGEILLVQ